jgi:hypothetical protein
MVAPRAPSHYVRVTTDKFFRRFADDGQAPKSGDAGSQRHTTEQTRRMTMKKDYEGLPAARNVEESILRAQLQIVNDLERRKQSAAAVQLLIDSVIESVTRVAA